jgi:hypothetical protein
VIILYIWDASAPGTDGGGVTDDHDSAKTAAVAWMRAHKTDTARVEQVQLALGGGGLLTTHEHTGRTWIAQRQGNHHITWTRHDHIAPELAAS